MLRDELICFIASSAGIAGLYKIYSNERNRRAEIVLIDNIIKEIEMINAQGASHE